MDVQFDKFVEFCEGHLECSQMKLLDLVKKRYYECDREYTNSQEFSEYILCTEAKINSDKARFFVHLRDFLNILKENKAENEQMVNCPVRNGIKREHESCDGEDEISSKRKRTEKNEGKGQSVMSSSESSSDNEIKRVPIFTEYTFEKEREKLSESLSAEGSDMEGDETKNSCMKFQTNIYLPESEKNAKSAEKDQALKSFKTCKEEIKTMFSSSEDEACEEDTKTALDIENIILKHENEIVTYVKEDERKEQAGKQEGVISTEKIGSMYNKTDTDNPDEPELNEIENILNTSQESVVILEGSEGENLNEEMTTKDQPKTENLEKENCIGGQVGKDSRNLESSSGPERIKCKYTDLNSSEEVTIIEDNDFDEEKRSGALILEDTKYFGEDSCSENDNNVKKEPKSRTNEVNIGEKVSHRSTNNSSSDEEEPCYAIKARKFKEKCKKKYVVSVGKKNTKGFSTNHCKDHLKPSSVLQSPKCSSLVKKKSPSHSLQCKKMSSKKKSSQSKSQILIMTDSESESDANNIVDFKKKFDEKVNKKIKKQFHIKDDPAVVIEKISFQYEPMEINENAGISNESVANDESSKDSSKETMVVIDHKEDFLFSSNKENILNEKDTGAVYDADGKKSDRTAEVKEKTRVSFITEEIYKSKPDSIVVNKRSDTKFEKFNDSGSVTLEQEHKNEQVYDDEENNIQNDDEAPGPSYVTDRESVKKRGSSKQIKKLEALLENIRNQIEKVRTRELDLDDLDSEISDYMLEDKLQRKFMKVWNKLCELHKASKSTGRQTDKYFRYQGTRYPEINRKMEKFVNKKKIFPDYHDVRNLIMSVNKKKRLHLRTREMDDLAREAFTDVGNQLQRRRQRDLLSAFHTPGADVNPFSFYDDPALYDPDLKKKLDANKKSARSNMEKVVEKYAALQYQVGDKTDEEDDEEEDDEEENDTNTGIEDIDQLSGVDNSDSDNNTAQDDEHVFIVGHRKYSSHKTLETGPCLEIENLENGKKSTFSNDNPDDVEKLSPMKSRDASKRLDWSPKRSHFSDQLGLCPVPGKKEQNETVTVTVLSDNDDDNEVKCCKENDYYSDDYDDSKVCIDKVKDDGNGFNDMKTSCDTEKADKVSDKGSVGVADYFGNEKKCVDTESSKAVQEHTDVNSVCKFASQVSVTIITDDEEDVNDEGDDLSLGLKIVSARHMSLDDINKLDADVDFDCTSELNLHSHDVSKTDHSSNACCEPVILDIEIENEMQDKTVVLQNKKQPAVEALPCYNKKTTKSEPEVMIVEDEDTVKLPLPQKSSNVRSKNVENFTWKTEIISECIVRQSSNLEHLSEKVDNNLTRNIPFKTHPCKSSEIVIIDVEESKENTYRTDAYRTKTSVNDKSKPKTSADNTSKPKSSLDNRSNPKTSPDSKSKPKSSLDNRSSPKTSPDSKSKPKSSLDNRSNPKTSPDSKSKPDCDVICIDAIPDVEIVGDNFKTNVQSMCVLNSENNSTKHNETRKSTDFSKDVSLDIAKNKICTHPWVERTEECNGLSKSVTVEFTQEDDLIKRKENLKNEEKSQSSALDNVRSPEDIFAGSCSSAESNAYSDIEFCKEGEVIGISEQSLQQCRENAVNIAGYKTVSLLTVKENTTIMSHTNDKSDAALTHELNENENSQHDSSEIVNVEAGINSNESIPLVDSFNMAGEESLASSDEFEVFTAVKLDTVFVDEKHDLKKEGEEIHQLDVETELEKDRTLVDKKEEFGDSVGFVSEDLAFVRNDSNADISEEPEINHNVNRASGMVAVSEDEEEISGGYEDEDKITSTFCEAEITKKGEVELKSPEIRNRFLQLKKAIVNAKPHLELKSQVKIQELASHIKGSSHNSHWTEKDENASLIETYQEPDSTPNNLEDNMISSSSTENIIVLSDSE